MSSWRLPVRALYEIGRPATANEVDIHLGGIDYAGGVGALLGFAKAYGLADNDGRGGCRVKWWLTPAGIDWCEGRCEIRQGSKRTRIPGAGAYRLSATWLSSLPRGVRIEPGPLQRAAALEN